MRKDKKNLINSVSDWFDTLMGVAISLEIGRLVLGVITKEEKLNRIRLSMRHYWRVGNLKKVIEGCLRYIFVWGFE
jgi:hypothetical protein